MPLRPATSRALQRGSEVRRRSTGSSGRPASAAARRNSWGGAAAAGAAAGCGGFGGAPDGPRRDSFAGFLDAVRDRLGPLDVLVNNAGVMHVGPFLEEDDAWTARQLAINAGGVVLGMKLAL